MTETQENILLNEARLVAEFEENSPIEELAAEVAIHFEPGVDPRALAMRWFNEITPGLKGKSRRTAFLAAW